jgi:hypothetical protein
LRPRSPRWTETSRAGRVRKRTVIGRRRVSEENTEDTVRFIFASTKAPREM